MDRALDGWELLYGTLTFLTVGLSMLTRCPGVRRAAGFILCCWIAYIFMQRTLHPHTLALVASHVDAVGVVFGLTLKGKNGRKRHSPYVRWVWVFIACHVTDMLIHLWFLFMPVEKNWIYYASLNGVYVVILASICAPSIGYYVRMRNRHNRRPPIAERDVEVCEMRQAYCRRCGPLGVRCHVTGKVTAKWANDDFLERLRPY